MVSETKQPKPKLLSGPILRQKLALSQQPVETIAGVQRDSSWSKLGESLLSVQPSFKQNTRSSLKRLAQIERLLPILDVHGASRAKLFKYYPTLKPPSVVPHHFFDLDIFVLAQMSTDAKFPHLLFLLKFSLRYFGHETSIFCE
ncbi:MAG: hypothetical protein MHPSP_002264 [Paramarteilia canceri]